MSMTNGFPVGVRSMRVRHFDFVRLLPLLLAPWHWLRRVARADPGANPWALSNKLSTEESSWFCTRTTVGAVAAPLARRRPAIEEACCWPCSG